MFRLYFAILLHLLIRLAWLRCFHLCFWRRVTFMLSSYTSHPPLPLGTTRQFFSSSFIKIVLPNHKACLLSWNENKMPYCLRACYSFASSNKKKIFLSFSGTKLAKPLSLQQRRISCLFYFTETEIRVLRTTPQVTCQNTFRSVPPHLGKERIWSRKKQNDNNNKTTNKNKL